jgi:hypothetical protein
MILTVQKITSLILSLALIIPLSGQKSELWVGASSAKIIPKKKETVFLAGTKVNRMATGVHDPIYAKAVFVSDGITSFALLSLDCIGLMYPDIEKIKQKVAKSLKPEQFNADQIVVTSTHTHHAPDVVGLWGETRAKSGVNQRYLDRIIEISAKQIILARKKKKKATIKYGTTKYGEGWVANISIEGELDDEVSAIQFLDAKGKSIATMTNFACHTTVLNGDATLISSDYAGGLYRRLDKKYKGVNIFLQGAIGGWVQPVNTPDNYENAMRTGERLGLVVTDVLTSGQIMDNKSVSFQTSKFKFPVENSNFKLLSNMKVVNRPFTETVVSEISYFTIGDAAFVTHPGETSPVYSTQSKKMMPVKGPKFVIGLGQDALGYILKPSFFSKNNGIEHSEYLTSMSVHNRAAVIMMQEIQKLTSQAKE